LKFSVTITLKNDVLDPQGKVIESTLQNMGMDTLKSLRQGKYFEIEINENDENKAKLKLNREAKNPIIIDFSKIKNMKQLEIFCITIDPNFGIKTQNTIDIVNCKKIASISLNVNWTYFKIDIKELNLIFDKIATDRQKFLINANKDKKYKDIELIDSRTDLDEEDKERYDLITEDVERRLVICAELLDTTIFNTYKKKVKK
jgi:phosphoribosylformylglycinamidine synthase